MPLLFVFVCCKGWPDMEEAEQTSQQQLVPHDTSAAAGPSYHLRNSVPLMTAPSNVLLNSSYSSRRFPHVSQMWHKRCDSAHDRATCELWCSAEDEEALHNLEADIAPREWCAVADPRRKLQEAYFRCMRGRSCISGYKSSISFPSSSHSNYSTSTWLSVPDMTFMNTIAGYGFPNIGKKADANDNDMTEHMQMLLILTV